MAALPWLADQLRGDRLRPTPPDRRRPGVVGRTAPGTVPAIAPVTRTTGCRAGVPGRSPVRETDPPMDLAVLATTFALIFAVELPDKTFIATIVLATRFPHSRGVDRGRAPVFLVQTLVAILAGRSRDARSPPCLVIGISAVLFAIGAVVLWRNSDTADEEALEERGQAVRPTGRCRHRLQGGIGLFPRAVRRRVGRPLADPHGHVGGALSRSGGRRDRRVPRCSPPLRPSASSSVGT